jgi:hypothetical protein
LYSLNHSIAEWSEKMRRAGQNGIASASDWRAARRAARAERAERLRLPSGATILAARPEPIEWILAGRVPQRLLAAALSGRGAPAETEISREDVLELARFAAELVRASVVEPPIGAGEGEIALEEIPVEDRAFIFEWACRALAPGDAPSGAKEDPSSRALERFCAK